MGNRSASLGGWSILKKQIHNSWNASTGNLIQNAENYIYFGTIDFLSLKFTSVKEN